MPKGIRSLTLRIPEQIHHKLKIIAAIQNTTLTGAICYLVDKENVHAMEQTPVLKSLLYSATDIEETDQAEQQPRPQIKKREPKIKM